MLVRLALATLAATLTTAVFAAGPADLAFMRGSWEGRDGPLTFEERWTDEAGGLMLGVSRTLKGSRAVGFEFLRVEFRKDTVVYVAQPGGKPKTEFRLTASGANSATFENPAHDHPKLIRYLLNAEGELVAELEGAEKPQRFVFKPVSR
ncbi:hypothetical protein J2X20_003478 [Pelomonas saccharophila]|uniref:DUF6265 domain-containing protein n=1 Tax=Roseateles saccharophilus TaxID=304 RepID=A0ABU1YPM8_ROSSA|nr:DUF6265 family protein [Roseateles saccharophilus]MDR7270820.1 hypothetical protein [Roseateles saccharophilus]